MDNLQYFLGIDAGGTKCNARLVDSKGMFVAKSTSDSANAVINLTLCQHYIVEVAKKALKQSNLNLNIKDLTVVAGVAGANLPEVKAQMQGWAHPFKKFRIETDLYIACIGAHHGDGAVIVAGTGSAGIRLVDNKVKEFGGHGFLLGDKGSGAWIGLQALRYTLEESDGLHSRCDLCESVYTFFKTNKATDIISHSLNAPSSLFAQLAPQVVTLANQGNQAAVKIIKQAATYFDKLIEQVLNESPLRLSMLGGLSESIYPWLSPNSQKQLSTAISSPEYGAAILAMNLE
ncbi:BadF/BadG/BcrA/BcrD ATPase family protein [Thalassotalea aquiviva]|uniref:BadF/BadG/BcrA/BcrD ATPase family protein n=1 Tax=Thalassotalea aquiviva TaxID=3242415 RepID=UPI00352A3FBE